jgi:hypothetical protein
MQISENKKCSFKNQEIHLNQKNLQGQNLSPFARAVLATTLQAFTKDVEDQANHYGEHAEIFGVGGPNFHQRNECLEVSHG